MFENSEINPAEVYQKLLENARLIDAKSKELVDKRNEVVIAEAELMDIKVESFKKSFANGVGITEAREWQKLDALEAEKKYKKAQGELRNLSNELRVLEEVNANYKMAVKMAQVEIANLGLR